MRCGVKIAADWLTAVEGACTIVHMTHDNTTPTLYDIELWSLNEDGTLAESLGRLAEANASDAHPYRSLLYTFDETFRRTANDALLDWTDGAWREQMAEDHPHGWHAIYAPINGEELS